MRKFRRTKYNGLCPQYIVGKIYHVGQVICGNTLTKSQIKYNSEFWIEVFDKPKLFKLL